MEAVMKKIWDCAQLRATLIALTGVTVLCFAEAAIAESQAAKKLGQITVINQMLQPKPLKANSAAPANNNNVNTSNATTRRTRRMQRALTRSPERLRPLAASNDSLNTLLREMMGVFESGVEPSQVRRATSMLRSAR
jgi:hypothetical protein